ncbi:Pyruvate kinase [Paenibacillus auburnensis]|jgi:pyruvate kinase|uniref:Pyruvate kinase n=1 Tax=Paenibacillus auburnensis TaxID=2905649 RepID=A0ABM9BRX9_9BACL|nr:pyruvate kinase [Paenibacillus auburnensis]CAH1193234.1 Pyruvate kinase [Paenibacillus auburnensis]
MRKTKIVCTIGPSSESPEMLRKLIQAGMNVARLNFAHGELDEHAERIRRIREAAKELNQYVAVLLDIKGPEIRIGKLASDYAELIPGEAVVLTTEEVLGTKDRIQITYKQLPQDVKPGSIILIDDGLIRLEVVKAEGTEITCLITNGGKLKQRKGVNVPGIKTSLPGVTEKDIRHIKFGIEQKIDIIAQSFVRKAEDILEIKHILNEHKAGHIQVIAKIENDEGVENLDAILSVADGLMVARGDLGVDLPVEDVPLVQKDMIKKCNLAGKPVITATHMLESMQMNPRPTRAEAGDVANAIFDGTDSVMLSGESAAGKYPLESVETMARIAARAESVLGHYGRCSCNGGEAATDVTGAIGEAVARTALVLSAKAILALTESGFTARTIAKHKPVAPVIAVSTKESVLYALSMTWGVTPLLRSESASSTDTAVAAAVELAKSAGYVQDGDLVVITAGVPAGRTGTTNLLRVHKVGEAL